MSERFDYEGYHKCKSHCLIEIHKHEKCTVVIATEADDNEGTSVTNMAEHIATEVCKAHEIPMLQLVWIEHYSHESFRSRDRDETWDLATFKRERTPVRGYWDYPSGQMVFTSPKWQPLTVAQKDRLVAGDLTVFKELKEIIAHSFFE